MISSPRRDLIYDLLAPPLILATPFVSFVNHNDYSYAAPEIWISLAGLLAAGVLCGLVMAIGGRWLRIIMMAGLVTLFVDFQFDWFNDQARFRIPALGIGVLLLCWLLREHLSHIAGIVFATMFATTLAFPGSSGEWSSDNPARRADAQATSRSAPPVLVHLILDGFIGMEGLPSDMPSGQAVKDMLRSFFHANGFYLFGRAYSRFHLTKNAIPSALSYGSMPDRTDSRSEEAIRNNKYFKELHKKGYRIHVYQPESMNYCAGYEEQVTSCRTFINTGIKPLEVLRLSSYQKAELALKIFARTSVIHGFLRYYYTLLRDEARERGYDLPPWVFGRYNLAPERAMHVLGIIADDVARAPAGEMFFAHLLVPHRPFILDRTCKLRDPQSWDVQNLDEELVLNRPEARAEQYELYFEQIMCVRAKLREMFDAWRRSGIYDRTKIVVHGDHGSRIALHEPTGANRDRILPSDYTDSFSTLFAVKAPGLEPAYDTRMVAIQDLLMPVAHELPLVQLPVGETDAYVLLENGASMVRQPMPDFGDFRGEHRAISLNLRSGVRRPARWR